MAEEVEILAHKRQWLLYPAKMAIILQITFSSAFSWMMFCIFIVISLKFVPESPID